MSPAPSLLGSPLTEPPPAALPEHLLALAEAGRELSAGGSLRERLIAALPALERHLGAKIITLCVADRENRAIEVEAAHGIGSVGFRATYGKGVAGRVAEGGRPIVVPIVQHEAMAMRELVDPSEFEHTRMSLVCVPLAMAGRSAGSLSAYFPYEPHADFAGRVSVLEVVASLFSQALRAARLELLAENKNSERERVAFEYSNMIGSGPAIRQVYEQIGQVARTNATALIRGESGTGKELVAHAIHLNSVRAKHPFVKINCAALPETLFESELFGHERGAFTGALTRKKGRFELAQGGTLFLDEIGELPITTQAKLLRVLQFREFERVGGTETLRADMRLVVATNKNMEQAVSSGSFREDLYYRLNVFTITLPPLRHRRVDIPALAEYFLQKFATEHRRPTTRISSGALEILSNYAWPGNVRELENAIERAVVVCDGFVLQERHLPEAILNANADPPSEKLGLTLAVEQLERKMIEAALAEAKGNAARAARALGTTERILRYKAQKYGIDGLRTKP